MNCIFQFVNISDAEEFYDAEEVAVYRTDGEVGIEVADEQAARDLKLKHKAYLEYIDFDT